MASIQHRPGRPKPWRVRYRDPQGSNRAQSFVRKVDARAFANSVETDMLRGQCLDSRASKIRFDEFTERWAASLTVDAKTAEGIASRLRAHLLPAFGDLEIRHLKPSTIQGWLGGVARTYEPSFVRPLLGTLSTVLGAAVEDGLIPSSPCRSRSVKAPALPDARRDAWDPATVEAVRDGLSDRHRALVPVAAGFGVRQGEAFGLGVDMIDFLRREFEVRRQVKWLSGRGLVFAPPMRKARTVPLPEVVAVALAEHIRRFPPVEVTLPWTGKGGGEGSVPLGFTNTAGGPLNRGCSTTGRGSRRYAPRDGRRPGGRLTMTWPRSQAERPVTAVADWVGDKLLPSRRGGVHGDWWPHTRATLPGPSQTRTGCRSGQRTVKETRRWEFLAAGRQGKVG